MQPFRITPNMPPGAYKTYQLDAPPATHWRPATCAEVDCEHHRNGWRVRVEGLSPQMLHTARTSGRRFTEQQVALGETWLVFEAGQACFRAAGHRVPLEREPLCIVRNGDWRSDLGGTRVLRPPDWVDDFATHQNKLADQLQKG